MNVKTALSLAALVALLLLGGGAVVFLTRATTQAPPPVAAPVNAAAPAVNNGPTVKLALKVRQGDDVITSPQMTMLMDRPSDLAFNSGEMKFDLRATVDSHADANGAHMVDLTLNGEIPPHKPSLNTRLLLKPGLETTLSRWDIEGQKPVSLSIVLGDETPATTAPAAGSMPAITRPSPESERAARAAATALVQAILDEDADAARKRVDPNWKDAATFGLLIDFEVAAIHLERTCEAAMGEAGRHVVDQQSKAPTEVEKMQQALKTLAESQATCVNGDDGAVALWAAGNTPTADAAQNDMLFRRVDGRWVLSPGPAVNMETVKVFVDGELVPKDRVPVLIAALRTVAPRVTKGELTTIDAIWLAIRDEMDQQP